MYRIYPQKINEESKTMKTLKVLKELNHCKQNEKQKKIIVNDSTGRIFYKINDKSRTFLKYQTVLLFFVMLAFIPLSLMGRTDKSTEAKPMLEKKHAAVASASGNTNPDNIILGTKNFLLKKDRSIQLDDRIQVKIKDPKPFQNFDTGYMIVRASVEMSESASVYIGLDNYKTLLDMTSSGPNQYRRLMANIPEGKHNLTVYAFYDKTIGEKSIRYYNKETIVFHQIIIADFSFRRVWLPYIYLYGVGGLIFLIGLFLVYKHQSMDKESPKERFYYKVLFFGIIWFMGLHLFFNTLAMIFN